MQVPKSNNPMSVISLWIWTTHDGAKAQTPSRGNETSSKLCQGDFYSYHRAIQIDLR
jgi:hypothetical protein